MVCRTISLTRPTPQRLFVAYLAQSLKYTLVVSLAFCPPLPASNLPLGERGGDAGRVFDMDLTRIELVSPQCECGVLPLYYRPPSQNLGE